MMFQSDILISWDLVYKDYPKITITSVKYDPDIKNIVGEVIGRIDATIVKTGCASVNQLIYENYLEKARQDTEKAKAALKAIQEKTPCE